MTSDKNTQIITSRILVALVFLLLSSATLIQWMGLSWFDQHRVTQIAAMGLTTFLLMLNKKTLHLDARHINMAYIFIGWGAISSVLSNNWFAGLSEVALFISMWALLIFSWNQSEQDNKYFLTCLIISLRLIVYGLAVFFGATYAGALKNPTMYFSPSMLIDGFSNLRYQGQFFTMALPVLLVASKADTYFPTNRLWRNADVLAVLFGVTLVLIAGTRGTVAAWLAVGVVLFVLGPLARRLAIWMFLALLVCLFTVPLLMSFLPGGMESLRADPDSLMGMSGREILWEIAIKNIMMHPWFGVGPMGFSDLSNQVAAHPHQFLLQLASEWGLPVAMGALIVLGRLAYRVCMAPAHVFIRLDGQTPWLAWGVVYGLFGGLIQAMVDGIFITPYSQIWISILFGLMCRVIFFRPKLVVEHRRINFTFGLIFLAALWLIFVVISKIELASNTDFMGTQPRFWITGGLRSRP